jgi:hypothetical protein
MAVLICPASCQWLIAPCPADKLKYASTIIPANWARIVDGKTVSEKFS